jgi:hypothetical protein
MKQRRESLYARDGLYRGEGAPDTLAASSRALGAVPVDAASVETPDDSFESDDFPVETPVNRRSIPELERVARESYVATASDARVARLAFAAATPPSEDGRSFTQEDDDNLLSVKVDYCIFCYHGLHILNHEVRGVDLLAVYRSSLCSSSLFCVVVVYTNGLIPWRFGSASRLLIG